MVIEFMTINTPEAGRCHGPGGKVQPLSSDLTDVMSVATRVHESPTAFKTFVEDIPEVDLYISIESLELSLRKESLLLPASVCGRFLRLVNGPVEAQATLSLLHDLDRFEERCVVSKLCGHILVGWAMLSVNIVFAQSLGVCIGKAVVERFDMRGEAMSKHNTPISDIIIVDHALTYRRPTAPVIEIRASDGNEVIAVSVQ